MISVNAAYDFLRSAGRRPLLDKVDGAIDPHEECDRTPLDQLIEKERWEHLNGAALGVHRQGPHVRRALLPERHGGRRDRGRDADLASRRSTRRSTRSARTSSAASSQLGGDSPIARPRDGLALETEVRDELHAIAVLCSASTAAATARGRAAPGARRPMPRHRPRCRRSSAGTGSCLHSVVGRRVLHLRDASRSSRLGVRLPPGRPPRPRTVADRVRCRRRRSRTPASSRRLRRAVGRSRLPIRWRGAGAAGCRLRARPCRVHAKCCDSEEDQPHGVIASSVALLLRPTSLESLAL